MREPPNVWIKMIYFRRKQKIRFSPRLAATAGRTPYIPHYFRERLSIFIPLTLILLVLGIRVVTHDGKIKSESRATTQNEGQVLGAEDADVMNYAVKSGDTLMSLGERFQVYWMTIVEENELKAPYTLQPGQMLRIPLPRN